MKVVGEERVVRLTGAVDDGNCRRLLSSSCDSRHRMRNIGQSDPDEDERGKHCRG